LGHVGANDNGIYQAQLNRAKGTRTIAQVNAGTEAAWESQLARLAAYKSEHGDCNVPVRYANDLKLGQWLATQRKQKRYMETGQSCGLMTLHRVAQLNDLGCVWEYPQGGRW